MNFKNLLTSQRPQILWLFLRAILIGRYRLKPATFTLRWSVGLREYFSKARFVVVGIHSMFLLDNRFRLEEHYLMKSILFFSLLASSFLRTQMIANVFIQRLVEIVVMAGRCAFQQQPANLSLETTAQVARLGCANIHFPVKIAETKSKLVLAEITTQEKLGICASEQFHFAKNL